MPANPSTTNCCVLRPTERNTRIRDAAIKRTDSHQTRVTCRSSRLRIFARKPGGTCRTPSILDCADLYTDAFSLHKTALIFCWQRPRATVCTCSGKNAERVVYTVNDFNVSVLVDSTSLVDKDKCEDRNSDRLVMEPCEDTHATFQNRDDRRQRKCPYTRTTSRCTVGYHHAADVSTCLHTTTMRATKRPALCTTVQSWRWNVLRCTRCVERGGGLGRTQIWDRRSALPAPLPPGWEVRCCFGVPQEVRPVVPAYDMAAQATPSHVGVPVDGSRLHYARASRCGWRCKVARGVDVRELQSELLREGSTRAHGVYHANVWESTSTECHPPTYAWPAIHEALLEASSKHSVHQHVNEAEYASLEERQLLVDELPGLCPGGRESVPSRPTCHSDSPSQLVGETIAMCENNPQLVGNQELRQKENRHEWCSPQCLPHKYRFKLMLYPFISFFMLHMMTAVAPSFHSDFT